MDNNIKSNTQRIGSFKSVQQPYSYIKGAKSYPLWERYFKKPKILKNNKTFP